MQLKQHITSCGCRNCLFTGGVRRGILLGALSSGPDLDLPEHASCSGEREKEIRIRNDKSTCADSGASFRPSEELDDNNGDSGESDLDTVGTTVHVVWEDDKLLPDGNPDPCCNRPPQSCNRDDVFYTRSIDDGLNFGTPVNLTNSDDVHNRDPDVAADGNLVGITYEARDEITGLPDLTNGDDVFFLRSADSGDTWGSEVSLTPNMAGNQDEPAIDIEETTAGQTVHVAFRNRSGPTIAYVRSTDGG